MSDFVIDSVAASRAEIVARSLMRHKLVFVQMGAAFDPILDSFLTILGHPQVSLERAIGDEVSPMDASAIVIPNIEVLVKQGANPSMGAIREHVHKRVEAGQAVCLLSRSPRAAFASVPGSSLLEDCALASVPLLSEEEHNGKRARWASSWKIPALSEWPADPSETLRLMLSELGWGVLVALDHALFEVDPKTTDGLRFLNARDQEALRCAGIVEISQGSTKFVLSDHLSEFKDALSVLLGAMTDPPEQLNTVASGLWYLERRVRSALRDAAVAKDGVNWRGSLLGKLSPEILRRAQMDSNITAISISELRDPLEWLTLGELLDLVRSERFANLDKDPLIWRRLQEQVVPIRNRLAHVRLLKATDEETVATWAVVIPLRRRARRGPR